MRALLTEPEKPVKLYLVKHAEANSNRPLKQKGVVLMSAYRKVIET